MVTAPARAVVAFSLSPGKAHDAPEGCALLETIERSEEQRQLLMYKGDATLTKALEKGFIPVALPKSNGIMISSDINNGTRLNGG